jgi:mannose-1-phosphate guanylyltransferase
MLDTADHHDVRAVVLAGGEGVRLRRLTQLVSGDERPKQFARLLGDETLLQSTRRRVRHLIDPDHTSFIVLRDHGRYWAPSLDGVPARALVVQPRHRGTAAAILYGLLRVARAAPTATVAIFPSDHWVSDDVAFMRQVARACTAVERRREVIVLLGVTADRAEVEYGWIEPGDAIGAGPLRRIRRFVEKPPPPIAQALYERGGLWNTFVMVGSVPAFTALVRLTAPSLWAAFAPVRKAVGMASEADVVERVYEELPPTDFSGVVLSRAGANVAVLPVEGVAWSDWGKPERVLATLSGLGIVPRWAARVAAL